MIKISLFLIFYIHFLKRKLHSFANIFRFLDCWLVHVENQPCTLGRDALNHSTGYCLDVVPAMMLQIQIKYSSLLFPVS